MIQRPIHLVLSGFACMFASLVTQIPLISGTLQTRGHTALLLGVISLMCGVVFFTGCLLVLIGVRSYRQDVPRR